MDAIKYNYNEKSWKPSSTISDKNSFFHAAFGTRVNKDEPYLDKRVKYRRSRWASFLNYFEDETMPPDLADLLKKCLSANEKYKHVYVKDQEHFEDYIWDVTKAEYDVTMEEIPILAALDNVKIVLFKDGESKPAGIIYPDSQILGSYPNMERPKEQVVLHLKGNFFSRMNPVPKYKKGGSAGSQGVQYQVGLLTVSFLNALQKHTNWRLSTENVDAGKFDDMVMEWPDGATLLEAKFKQRNKRKINFEELLSIDRRKDAFSIPKYFLSYEEIKNKFQIKELILCTNGCVDGEAMKYLDAQKVGPESLLHYENCDCEIYTFTDEIIPYLKERVKSYYKMNFRYKGVDEPAITEENIKKFLKHLQLFFNYPSENDIVRIIEKMLSHMKLLQNAYIDVSSLDIYSKILDWFQHNDGVYLTELYAKAMFSEIWRDKHWQSLEKYNIFFRRTDLNLQNSKRLFHLTVEGEGLLQVMKIFQMLQSNKTKFLFVNLNDGTEKWKQVIETFVLPKYTILVIVSLNVTECVITEASCKLRTILETFLYKKIVLIADCSNMIPQFIRLSNYEYDVINEFTTVQDLSIDSQERLLRKDNIIFQGNNISLMELFAGQVTEDYAKFISDQVLEKLVKSENIKVGAPLLELDEQFMQFYIKRKFRRRDEIFPEELICEMNEKIMLISDSAGTGKSTVLTNLAVTTKKKYPHLWVIRIDLHDYIYILRDFLMKNNKTINIIDLLNSKHSTKLTNQLEDVVFSMNERVVLMFDGFDKISPDYTQLVLSLLSLSREQQNIAKVIVTTRPHLTRELEETMQVEPFILEPFTKQNQIDFFTGYWMASLDVYYAKKDKYEQYAKVLIEKMGFWIRLCEPGTNHFAETAFHIRMLAEIFRESNQNWDGCKEYLLGKGDEPKLPENMNVARLYEILIEKKRGVFIEKENPSGSKAVNRALIELFEECLTYHGNLALKLILDKAQCKLFSLRRKPSKNVEIIVSKIGIIEKVDNKFNFADRTFAEFFVAQCLIEELRLPNENIEFQKLLIEEILLKPQFVIHVFFNSFLQQLIDHSPNVFYDYHCVSYKITSFDKNKFLLLKKIVESGHLAIFQLILNCVDLNFFSNIPEGSTQFFQTPVGKSIPKYSNILNVVQREANKLIPKTFLEYAAAAGHLEMVKFLVEQGANVNIGDFKPLHMAVDGGHFEVAKFLVEQGADIRAKDRTDDTTVLYKAVLKNDTAMTTYLLNEILHSDGSNITDAIIPYTAAYLGRIDILQKLVEQGLAVDFRVENHETAIFSAVRGGQLETIRYLQQQGCDVNSRDYRDNTALHIYAQNPSLLSTAKLLVDLKIDVNARNINFATALHIAIEGNHFDLIELLVNHTADVNLEDVKGNSALHIAAQNLRGDIVKLLIRHGANIDSQNKYGNTALHLVTQQNSIHFRNDYKQFIKNSVKLLIGNGDSVNIKNCNGSTVLHLAAKTGQIDIAILLLESEARTDITDNVGRTALHLAALENHTHIIEYLIQHKADCNIRDTDGYTVLHYLVRFKFVTGDPIKSKDKNNCNILRLVIENSKDVNLKALDGLTALQIATRYGNLDAVNLLVQSGADVNIRDNKGRTALHLAAKEGHFTVTEYLLKSGADITVQDNFGYTVLHLVARTTRTKYKHSDFEIIVTECSKLVDMKDNTGCTALHLAASKGSLEVVKSLVEHGTDVDSRNVHDHTVLHVAARKNHVEIVKFLIESGADFSNRDNKGRTALHLAVEKDAFDVVVFLVKFGVHVDTRDDTGSTALHKAVSSGHFNTVEYLVEAGVDIKIRNNRGYTALHLAAKGKDSDTTDDNSECSSAEEDTVNTFKLPDEITEGSDTDCLEGVSKKNYRSDKATKERSYLGIVHILARYKEAVNIQDNSERTALHLAVLKGHLQVAIWLLRYGTDVNSQDANGRTALHAAAQKGHMDIVKSLLEWDTNVNIIDESGRTALHLAVINDRLEVMEVLVQYGADVDVEDNSGQSALQLAIDDGKLDIVKLLVKYGANINADGVGSGKKRRTALHLAAQRGELDTVISFTELGIDVNVTDEKDYTALQLALDGGHLNVIKYLLESGADISVTDKNGNTALHLAVRNNRLDVVEFLVNIGIDLNVKNNEGRTALHVASERDRLTIANFLVVHGADLNLADKWGSTALHLAACCNLDFVKFLVERGADIDLEDGNGDTAAVVAKKKGRIDAFNYLQNELSLKNRSFD